jgi:hypothetical protein
MAENPDIDPELIKKYLDLMKEVYGVNVSTLDVEKARAVNLTKEIELLKAQKKQIDTNAKAEEDAAKKREQHRQKEAEDLKELTGKFTELTKQIKTGSDKQSKSILDTVSVAERLLNTSKNLKGLSSETLKIRLAEINLERKAALERKQSIDKEIQNILKRKNLSKVEKDQKINSLNQEKGLLNTITEGGEKQAADVKKQIPSKQKQEFTANLLGGNAGKAFTAQIGKDKSFGKSLLAGLGVGALSLFGGSKAAGQNVSSMGATVPTIGGSGGGGTPGAGGGGGGGGSTFDPSKLKVDPRNNKGNALGMIPDTGNPYIDVTKKVASSGFERFKKVDAEFSELTNLARSLNTTYDVALKVRLEMSQLASAAGSVFVTGEKMAKATIAMNEQLGVAVKYDNLRLVQQTQLRNQLKGSAEEVKTTSDDLLKSALIVGDQKQTEFDIFKNRLAQVRLVKIQTQSAIDERKVLMDIAKASNSIRINYLGSDAALTKAAASARALGTELSKMDKTADSLLNFETSIKDQMEAELLTGKNLNLDKARYYALTNDIGGLMQELNNQGIDAVKYGNMNRLAQESYAKSLGMSREDMSEMLIQQRVLSALKTDDLSKAKEEYKNAVLQGKEKQFLARLGDEGLATQFQQMSMQDRMAASQEKMAMALEALAVTLAGPVYETMLKGAEFGAQTVNAPQAMGLSGLMEGMGNPTAFFTTIAKLFADRSTKSYVAGGATPAESLEGKPIEKLAEGGLVTRSGIAQVDSGELYLGKTSASQLGQMVSELKAQTQYLTQLVNKNTTLVVNDQVLATSVARNASTVPGNFLNPGSSTYS